MTVQRRARDGERKRGLTRRMHHAADDEAADGRAGQVQRRPLLHAGVLDQLPLGEEIGRQLDGAAEARPDHGGRDAAVQAREALAAIDLPQSIPEVAVVVLRADRPDGGIALQPRLDQEKGTSGRGAEDARGGAAEDVDGEVLPGLVAQKQAGGGLAHGLVEAEAAAVEQDLVDVGGAEAAVDAADAFVLDDDADAVDGAAVVLRLGALCLELALQLLPDLEDLGRVRDGDGAAGCEGAGGEAAEMTVSDWTDWLATCGGD